MGILTLLCEIDDFSQQFEPVWKQHLLSAGDKHRYRERTLSLSEVMTILVLFHTTGYRNLKQFYQEFVSVHLTREFPALVSYPRFVQFEREALMPLATIKTQIIINRETRSVVRRAAKRMILSCSSKPAA